MSPKHLKLWMRPDNYAGASWPNTYAFLGQHRDSDCLARSNFRVACQRLDAAGLPYTIVRENHWAVGWVEWIAIDAGEDKALDLADSMMEDLEDYPVLSEEDFGTLEDETADTIWATCYRPHERIAYMREFDNQFEFHNLADMLGCARGKYFAGYASELIG